MINKWRDVRDSKNMKKVHKIAKHTATRIATQCDAQGSMFSVLVVYLICSGIVVLYWHPIRCTLRIKKWISWLLAHFSHFYIFPVLLLEKKQPKNSGKVTEHCYITHYIIFKFWRNPYITAQEMDFLIISSLFSFLHLSSSITGEVANEKFWKN